MSSVLEPEQAMGAQ